MKNNQPKTILTAVPDKKGVYKGHIAILLTNIFFGLNFVFAKNVDGTYISSEAFALLRMAGGVLFFWLIVPFCPHQKLERGDYIRLFFAGLFGGTINMYSFLKGITYTSPVDASIIMTLVPLSVLLLSAIFLGERITWVKMIGIILGALGAVALIAYSGTVNMGYDNLLGNLMCLGCVVSYTLYLIVMKPIMTKLHPLTVMRWVFLFSFIQTAPFFGKGLVNTNWSIMPTDTLISIGYVVIVATLLTYLLTSISLKTLSASTASMYNYMQPVIATVVAIILGQDSFSVIKLFAACLVFVGVYLVIRTKNTDKKIEPPR